MGHLNATDGKGILYNLTGKAADIETIVRLRPWMEEVVKDMHGDFSSSKLYTDYSQEKEIFDFKIVFFK